MGLNVEKDQKEWPERDLQFYMLHRVNPEIEQREWTEKDLQMYMRHTAQC